MTTINFENFSLVITDEEKAVPGGIEIPETLLANREALFHALQNSTILQQPKALARMTQSAESVAMWVTLNKLKHLTVGGKLSSKHFPPEQLRWYMKDLVRKHLEGKNERNISATGDYQVRGKSLIMPCEELINLCAEHRIVIKTTFCDPKSLKALRRELRNATMADMDFMWKKYGLPLKKTSYVMVGNPTNQLGKTVITHIRDDVERCRLMLYFSKVYDTKGVYPGVRNPLSHTDIVGASRLTRAEKKLAKGPAPKLSKADRKLMARGRKKKKNRNRKGSKKPARDTRAREMNRKFELLQLKRVMGLEKTVV